VVKSLAGTMLLELAPAQVLEVAQALPGWRYSVERKTARVPERKPLERSKAWLRPRVEGQRGGNRLELGLGAGPERTASGTAVNCGECPQTAGH
jgi:hypothetical protein